MRNWIAVLALTALAGCGSESGSPSGQAAAPQRTLARSNGTHNELTVICPENLWQASAGLAVAEVLGAPADGLPQAEPRFGIIHTVPEKVNSLLRKGKSMLSIEVIPDSTAVLEVTDAFARPQLVIQVIAPSAEALPQVLAEVLPQLATRFAAHDAKVLQTNLRRRSQKPLPSAVRALGVSDMLLPEGFVVTLSKPGVVVLRNETKKSLQYLILTRSASDDSPTPEADVIKDRDALLRRYFEGPEAKSHLATELLVPPSQMAYTAPGGHRALRTIGLFKTVGGFGGGPFLNHRVFDDTRGIVGTADALVFAPSTKKRKLQMELDEVAASVRWGDVPKKP